MGHRKRDLQYRLLLKPGDSETLLALIHDRPRPASPSSRRGKCATGRAWVYVRDDRPFGGPERTWRRRAWRYSCNTPILAACAACWTGRQAPPRRRRTASAVRATLDWIEATMLETRGWDPATRRRPLVRGGELIEVELRSMDRAFVTDRAVKAERQILASMRAGRGQGVVRLRTLTPDK